MPVRAIEFYSGIGGLHLALRRLVWRVPL
jgi:site-specific DNA-cytosine methylase